MCCAGRCVAEGKAVVMDALQQAENPSHSEVKCTAGELLETIMWADIKGLRSLAWLAA